MREIKSPSDVLNDARKEQQEKNEELKAQLARLTPDQQKMQEPLFKQKQQQMQQRGLANAIVKMVENERLATSIIDVFELLPPSTDFLLKLMNHYLTRARSSVRICITATRDALLRYLNRFSGDAVTLVLRQVDNEELLHIFIGLLSQPDAVELRDELANSVPLLLQATFMRYATHSAKVKALLPLPSQLVLPKQFWHAGSASTGPRRDASRLVKGLALRASSAP